MSNPNVRRMPKGMKAKLVLDFIKRNNPTRKQIIGYIVVHLNKICTQKVFEETYATRFRGYYGVAFQIWYDNGNIKRDPKTNRISLVDGHHPNLYQKSYATLKKRYTNLLERRSNGYVMAEVNELNHRIRLLENEVEHYKGVLKERGIQGPKDWITERRLLLSRNLTLEVENEQVEEKLREAERMVRYEVSMAISKAFGNG